MGRILLKGLLVLVAAWALTGCVWSSAPVAVVDDVAAVKDSATAKDAVHDTKAVDTGPHVGKCSCPKVGPCTPCPLGQACIAGACYSGWCGLETCAANQWCTVGLSEPCVAIACALPKVVTPFAVLKVTKATALGGYGTGCDLNGDGKPDNAMGSSLSMILGQVNANMVATVGTGEFVRLFEVLTTTSTGEVTVASLDGQPAPDMGACDLSDSTTSCNVWIRKQSYMLNQPAACAPRTVCSGSWSGSKFSTTCPVGTPMPVMPKPEVGLPAYKVTVNGEMSTATKGTATVCGCFRLKDIKERMAALPVEVYSGYGIDMAGFLQLLKSPVEPDIDTDNDGKNDSYSFAASFEFGPATVTGIAK